MLACDSDEAPAGSDEAVEDAGGDFSDLGLALVPPEPPVLTPCPAGWAETEPDDALDVPTCQPWPDGRPQDCAAGFAHFPGESGCVPVGAACSEEVWAVDLPADDVIFVDAGAVAGDGSRESPYASVSAALAVATPGDVVALAKGTYTGPFELPAGITLWGACAAETVLAGSAEIQPGEAVVSVTGLDAGLRNVQVRGPGSGIQLTGSVSLTAHGITVEGATERALTVLSDAELIGDAILVRGTVAPNEELGVGLFVDRGIVRLVRVAIEANEGLGIMTFDADPMELTRIAVRNSRPIVSNEGALLGGGLFLYDGTHLTLSQAAVQCHESSGIALIGPDVQLDASDIVAGAIEGDPDCATRQAIAVQPEADEAGGRATLDRVWVSGARVAGIAVKHAHLDLSHAVVEQTEALFVDGYGAGLLLLDRATAEVDHAVLRSNFGVSIAVMGGNANLSATDLVVAETRGRECTDSTCALPLNGYGLSAAEGVVTLERFVIATSFLCGLQIGPGAEVDALEGRVSNNVIGVNVQAVDFDLGRVSRRVVYEGNESDLSADSLPIPAPQILGLGL